MGLLIDGVWQTRQEDRSASGHFERPSSVFRNWVTPDGRPGSTGHDGFAAAPGRYHLFVSLACPWAHRTLIARVPEGSGEHRLNIDYALAYGRTGMDIYAGGGSYTRSSL